MLSVQFRAKSICFCALYPPHWSVVMQTLVRQHVPTAHTLPSGQSALVPQPARPRHGVDPATQKPVPSVMLAHTQLPPGPQGPKVEHVCPVHELKEHAPLVQDPVGHFFVSFELAQDTSVRRVRGSKKRH